MRREFKGLAVGGKKTIDIDILITSSNGDRIIMQSV